VKIGAPQKAKASRMSMINLARLQGMSSSNLWLRCSAVRVSTEASDIIQRLSETVD